MDAGQFFSANLLRGAVLAATPLFVAGTGELITELGGTLNLGLAGLVVTGASVGATVTYVLGNAGIDPLWGILAAAAAGCLLGLLISYATVTLKIHQVTIGLTIFILTSGLADLIYRIGIGVTSTSIHIETLPNLRVPGLATIPILGRVLFTQTLYGYLAVALLMPLLWLLFRTNGGLRLRAVGENPRAVDSLGMNVFRIRYVSIVAGCMLACVGGAYFPLAFTGSYDPTSAIGQGWIALMLVIFGRWRPIPFLLGVGLFGYIGALQSQLMVTVQSVPPDLFLMLPYVLAMVVLVATYGRAVQPASLVKPYEREARY